MKATKKHLTEQAIDQIVESQAENDAVWGRPLQARRAKPPSLSLPAELAARAAFVANMHRERNVGEWLTKVIKERVELEEGAFREAKRAMALRNGV